MGEEGHRATKGNLYLFLARILSQKAADWYWHIL